MAEIRQVLRRKKVLEATGWGVSTLYRKISEGRFPPAHRLDPDGQTVVWFADEVAQWQAGEWKPAEAA